MTDLSSLGDASRGIWTRQDALRLLSPSQVRCLVHDGAWHSPFPGTFADRGFELDQEQWGWAAVLASRPRGALGAVACGRTAARIWALPLIDDRDPATGANDWVHHDVAVRRHAGLLRSRPVGPDDPVHTLHRHQLTLTAADCLVGDGLSVTGPARTLLDLAALLTHEALVCAMDDALRRGLVTVAELERMASIRRGRAYAPAFAAAVQAADGRAESPAETLARLILLPHLPGLTPQVKVLDARGGVVARLDLADQELRLAVEPDGKRWHAGEAMVARDRQRDATTGDRYGWWTERVTWYELRRRQPAFLRRVLLRAETLRRRRAS